MQFKQWNVNVMLMSGIVIMNINFQCKLGLESIWQCTISNSLHFFDYHPVSWMKFFKQLRCWSIINRFVAYVVIYLACLVPYFPDTYCLHVYGAVDLRILGLLYCVGLNHNKNLFICEVLGDIVAHCSGQTSYYDLAGLVHQRSHVDSRELCWFWPWTLHCEYWTL